MLSFCMIQAGFWPADSQRDTMILAAKKGQ
jgi:hypothetical protein